MKASSSRSKRVPEGRNQLAWGVSPRDASCAHSESPGGATSNRTRNECAAPPGLRADCDASTGGLRPRLFAAAAPRLFAIAAPRLCFAWLVAFSVISALSTTTALAIDTAELRRKQEDQQRARAMASKLIGSVLDLQLLQLEENNMQEMRIYHDIKTMRTNIGRLVESEMADVVDVLTRARSAKGGRREELFVGARQQIRTIVIRLAVERQALLKRLRIAEIVEQTRRLIRLQTETRDATKDLPSKPASQREKIALTTIEDQRDISHLFLHLVETLSDVSEWGGPLSTGAADALRITKAAEVGKHLDQAGKELKATRYSPAAIEQTEVIDGLKKILRIVVRTQGLIGSEKQELVKQIQKLAERQKELREQVRKSDLSQPTEQLIEEQTEIQQELQQLADKLESPSEQVHADQATDAAEEAAAKIFEGEKAAAVAEQNKVLGNLAALLEKLKANSPVDSLDKSAAELAQRVKDLEAAKQDLQQIQKQQEQASETARKDRKQAAVQEQKVAAKLTETPKNRDLPQNVESRVADAQEATAGAAETLTKADKTAGEQTEQALAEAEDSIERALAEVEAELDDTRRREAAVRIGEMARAAEALERAAAAERKVAKEADKATKQNDGLDVEKAKKLGQQQAEVNEVAGKIAAAVADAAPKAADAVKEAMNDADKAADNLKKSGEQKGEPAKEASKAAAENANDAAQKLAKGASELRKEIAKAARELAKMAAEQLQEVGDVQQPLEDAIANRPESIAEKLNELANAAEKVGQAKQEQQRASGKPEAAEAMDLSKKIADAAREQSKAEQAAADLVAGKANTPLKATAKQQKVADAADDLAKLVEQRPQAKRAAKEGKHDELTNALKDAQQAAAEAAKNTLDGKQAQAEAARRKANEALTKAQRIAKAEAKQAKEAKPTGQPDAKAQRQVADLAEAAKAMTEEDAPEANQALTNAAGAAEKAAKDINADDPNAAKKNQEKVERELDKAEMQIAKAMEGLAGKLAEQLAKAAKQAGDLAEMAADVSPEATSALRAAEQTANEAKDAATAMSDKKSEGKPAAAKDSEIAEEAIAGDLDRAAANLAAEEQELRAEKAIAEAIEQLAARQQEAADEIADTRDEAEDGKTRPPNELQKAAEALANAVRGFAKAQKITGLAAAELAEQKEIANPALREALELASNLKPSETGQTEPTAAKGEEPKPSNPEAADESHKPKGKETDLGTGLGPKSPEVTARMMAGDSELAKKAAALAKLDSAKGESELAGLAPEDLEAALSESEGKTAEGKSQQSKKSLKSSKSGSGGKAKDGGPTENQSEKDGELQNAEDSIKPGDSQAEDSNEKRNEIKHRRFSEEAWFAKLPADLRAAIRANARRRAPRAYEERLRRYFESID